MNKRPLFALWLLTLAAIFINYQWGDNWSTEPSPVTDATPVQYHPYSDLEGYDDILKLQAAFVRNARAIKPSVVSINNLREIPSRISAGDLLEGQTESWLPRIKNWVLSNLRRRYQVESLGSGVIYSENGYILTNYHVIEDSEQLLVKMADGREFTPKLVGADPMTDLAVLKIFSFSSFPAAPLGKSDDLSVGHWVMAIGNPYGLDGTVTVGVVSGKGRSDLGIATFENFLQTDASINPGNSGGPLINLNGEIIGINTAIAELGAGVGFAIPVEMARQVADALIDEGEVERGWLGVGIQPLTPELAESFNVATDSGVVINSLDSGSPAEQAGLLRGDVIVTYNGKKVANLRTLQRYVAETRIGKSVPVQIIREGEEKLVIVKVGKLNS